MTARNNKVPVETIETFIGDLMTLQSNKGAMAILRRNAGNSLQTQRGAEGTFYPILPREIINQKHKEEIFFMIATAFALHPKNTDKGNIGTLFRYFKLGEQFSAKSLETRFKVLLDEPLWQNYEVFAHRLLRIIRMAKQKDKAINYVQLTEDLLKWNTFSHSVQMQWTRSFYLEPSNEESLKIETKGVD